MKHYFKINVMLYIRNTPINAIDEINIPVTATEVWTLLADIRGYPRWWPKSLGIRVLSSGVELLGTEVEVHPFGGRQFRCRVEEVDKPKRIRMRYFGGFIDGFGEWTLESQGQETRVIYQLEAQAHGFLVAILGKFFNFSRLHSRLMQEVLRNLKDTLVRNQDSNL